MNNKNTLIAVAALASFSAYGQVNIYGRIDAGVERVISGGSPGLSVTRIPTLAGSTSSLLGFRTSEDLGGGLKAEAVLEMGFDPGAGTLNQGGRAFGRQSTVGLSGPWGSFLVGRQYSMYAWVMSKTELLGPNIYGVAQLDPYIAGPRADNSISYMGGFGAITVGATYSLGRDASSCSGELAADSKACRNGSWMVKYDGAKWGVAAAQDFQQGGPASTTNNGSPAQLPFTSDMRDKRSTVNGYVGVGGATVAAQWIRRTNDAAAASAGLTPTSEIWELGASYPITSAFVLAGEVARMNFKGSLNDSGATLVAIRGMYSFSRRTAAYVNVSRLWNEGSANLSVSGGTAAGTTPGAGQWQQGFMIGLRHSF